MVVEGDQGAYAWAYRDFSGDVHSTDGDAFLGACGNAVGNVIAGRDALAAVVGHFVGTLQADEYALALTLGNFHGSLSAGADGFIASEGSVNAGMTTGGDLYVWAIGDVAGNYHAGRDASVVTYADFSAALAADRDIGTAHYNYYGTAGVWARGDIAGTITAARNIGHYDHYYGYAYEAAWDYDIFSFGTINAAITATNPSGSPIGGRIGSIGAWGPIDGLIEADHSIQLVRSGDAVSATVLAPYIGSIIEQDSTITTAYPYPDTPESIKADVLAEAQAAYDEVLAVRDELADTIDQLMADFAAEKSDALADLAQQQAAVDAAIAETEEALQDKLAADVETAQQARTAAAIASAEEIASLRQLAHNEKQALAQARDAAKSAGDAAYQRALDEKETLMVQLADFDAQMLELKNQDAQAAESARGARAHEWDGFRLAVFGQLPADIDSGRPFMDPRWFQPPDSLYGYYFTHPSEMDPALRVCNNVAYGMIGTGVGGLAGLGSGALVGLVGTAVGSGTTATAFAGLLGGGFVGGKVGGAIGSIGGEWGETIGSIGGGFAGSWLAWGAAGGPTFAMARVSEGPHYYYSVTEGGTTTWSHWWGGNTTRGVEYFAARAGYWNTFRGIPIFYPKAALGTAGGSNCFTTCMWALWSGWTGF